LQVLGVRGAPLWAFHYYPCRKGFDSKFHFK
jgi:hypothetical protein